MIKLAPPGLDLEAKRQYYIRKMAECDQRNNDIKLRIQNMSSNNPEFKDNDWRDRWKFYKRMLAAGLVLREGYRLKIRRMKNTIKNKNIANNN